MTFHPTGTIDSCTWPDATDLKVGAVMRQDEDSATLIGLLLRAARLWPRNGITFKDCDYGHNSNLTTYADFLAVIEVREIPGRIDRWL